MKIPMSIYHVNSGLLTRNNFSADGLHPTRTNKIAYFSKFLKCFKKEWLFSPINTEDEKIEDAVACFNKYCSDVLNRSLDYNDTKEKFFFFKYATEVLVPLCSDVMLNSREYKSVVTELGASPNMSVGNLGLGTKKIWHGSPDCSLRAAKSVTMLSLPRIHTDEDTDGDATMTDAKLKIVKKHYQQLVRMNVVASFTEKNRHTDLTSTLPSMLIDRENILFSIYSCDTDELYISPIWNISTYSDGNYELLKCGALLLWLLVNHR